MKRLAILTTLFLFGIGLSAPVTAQAQSTLSVGPRIGIPAGDLSDAGGNFFFGADARYNTDALPVVPNASFDYYLTDIDNYSVFTIDLNALYPFGSGDMAFSPYGGGGLGITRTSSEFTNPLTGETTTDSNSEVGLNLVGGARFEAGSLQPFVQANVTVGGDVTRFGISGGLLFSL